MAIQVEQNGVMIDVTKQQLFDLAKAGKVVPETKIAVDGKFVTAAKVKGIEFGTPEAEIRGVDDIFGIAGLPPISMASTLPLSMPVPQASAPSATRFCPHCGQPVGSGAFCSSCGGSLTGGGERPPAAPTAAPAKKRGMSVCPDCEESISKSATECPHCGRKLGKSKVVAILLSIFVPGTGQLYQQRYFIGLVILVLWATVCGFMSTLRPNAGNPGQATGFAMMMHWFFAVPAIIMAAIYRHKNK